MEKRLLLPGASVKEDWVEVQKKTFTNWANETLKQEGVRVTNLETDLEDGVILIKLLEMLAPGRRMPGRWVHVALPMLNAVGASLGKFHTRGTACTCDVVYVSLFVCLD